MMKLSKCQQACSFTHWNGLALNQIKKLFVTTLFDAQILKQLTKTHPLTTISFFDNQTESLHFEQSTQF